MILGTAEYLSVRNHNDYAVRGYLKLRGWGGKDGTCLVENLGKGVRIEGDGGENNCEKMVKIRRYI